MKAARGDDGSPYAGFWVRFFSACVDLLVFAPVYLLLKSVEQGVARTSGAVDESMDFVTAQILPSTPYQWAFEGVFDLLTLLLYAWFLSSRWQGSPGMYLLKFRMGDREGRRISFARAFLWCATAVVGWLVCCAGVLYMQKDILIVADMLLSCREQNIDMGDCIPEIEKTIGIPFSSYQQLSYAAGGLFVFLYLIWALSIALPKDKTGFHNLICGTRLLKGRP